MRVSLLLCLCLAACAGRPLGPPDGRDAGPPTDLPPVTPRPPDPPDFPIPTPIPTTPDDRFGVTFATATDAPPTGTIHMSCHGKPDDLDNPHAGTCNPYNGDTSCKKARPILCIHKDGSAPPPSSYDYGTGLYNGWIAGRFKSSAPVVGSHLRSRAHADELCAAEHGADYEMAMFGGWSYVGYDDGVDGAQRHWVHIGDQPGNCWDP